MNQHDCLILLNICTSSNLNEGGIKGTSLKGANENFFASSHSNQRVYYISGAKCHQPYSPLVGYDIGSTLKRLVFDTGNM